MGKIGKLVFLAIFDIMVAVPFVASNWWIWNYLSGKITANVWGPFQITVIPQLSGGGPVGISSPIPNYPFILFWIALVGNFVIVFLLLRKNNSE
jgi:hypothetical protein